MDNIRQFRKYLRLIFLLIPLTLGALHAFAEEPAAAQPQTEQESVSDQLTVIAKDIQELQDKKISLNKEIKAEKDDAHKKELEDMLTRANSQLREYSDLFEKISLGGIDTSRFETPAKQAIQQVDDYNWQKELIQIAQPVFSEMKKLTDTPRKRDILRLEQKEINDRLAQLNKGLANIDKIDASTLPPEAQKNLKEIQEFWRALHKELEREYKLTVLKLDELTTKESFTTRLSKGAWDFVTGRGLLLFIAVVALSSLIYLFNRFLVFIESREKNLISIRWRIFILFYQIITTLFSVMVTLMILYSSGDMVLFGLAILIILAFLVTSRGSIPKYLMKMRVFLNIGQAREGERVLYNDLPWRINRINLYTVYLVNPLLENGTMRLTIDHLNNMISRPVKMDETWFPTVVNDIVMINGTQYKVMRQTPEYVYLTSSGTEMIYPSKDFLKDKILNVTYGYFVSTEFFIHYPSLNNDIEGAIQKLKDGLNEIISTEAPDAFKSVKSLSVDFSRLDDKNNAVFYIGFTMGSFATDYRGAIIRLAQRGAMSISEKHHWQLISIQSFSVDQTQ